jgi:FAD/FMN-containing dehydrogenase/Fe-S oxidoreductase
LNESLAVPPVPDAWRLALDRIRSSIAGTLRDDPVHRVLYATDASLYELVPAGVVFPRSAADVAVIVREAAAAGLPLTPRGAGTSLAGQAVGPGLIVDLGRHMNRVLDVDVEARTARVQPGVVRDDLNRLLAPHGLHFAPETSTTDRCMIGGMIGNNSCGSRSIVYGTTRDHVLSLDVVLSDGAPVQLGSLGRDAWRETVDAGGRLGEALSTLERVIGTSHDAIRAAFPRSEVQRRNTGYALDLLADSWLGGSTEDADLAAFFCGTEGTIGLVTEATIRLTPLPAARALLASHFADVPESMRATVALVEQGPAAVELMDKRILDLAALNAEQERNRWFIEGDPGALLITEFHAATQGDADAKVEAAIADLHARGMGYAHVIIPPARARSVWALREAGLGVLFGKPGDVKPITIVEDTAVAVDELPAFVDAFIEIMDRHAIDCVYYGHASVGELHLRPELNPKDAGDVQKAEAVAGEVADLVRRFGASLSGEHGDGRLRSPFIDRSMRAPVSDWLREVKRAFDPDGLLNPGNIVDPAPMTAAWRYPTEYTQVPFETEFAYAASDGFQRAVERCNGAGVCRRPAASGGTMCPSYMATGEESDTTRGRANLFRRLIQLGPDALFGSDELEQALDLCISCKGCLSDCPASVDMATLKAEFLQGRMDRKGAGFRSRSFAYSSEWGGLAQRVPGGAAIANFFQRAPGISKLGARMLGIAPERVAPAIAPQSFWRFAPRALGATVQDPVGRVLLFVDEFTDVYEPEVAVAAVELLNAGGYEVVAPRVGSSGRTFLSKGFVRVARERIEANIDALAPHIDTVDAVIGIEPSAALTLVHEGVDLVKDPARRAIAEKIAAKVRLVPDFVAHAADSGAWRGTWTDADAKILLHGHCHQKAHVGTEGMARALALPPNYTVEVIKSGCCGMAGSFGYEAQHYDLSMQIGELVLFPAVRAAAPEIVVAAPGFSCRHQIADGTNRQARNPIEILRDAALGRA